LREEEFVAVMVATATVKKAVTYAFENNLNNYLNCFG